MRTCSAIIYLILSISLVFIGVVAWLYIDGSNLQRFYIYSPDEEHVVTVISKDNNRVRYIIVGKYEEIPNNNYIKVDPDRWKNHMDICWEKDGYEWKLVNEGVSVIENSLVSNKYYFTNKYNKDKRGIPNRVDYTGDKCHSISVRHNMFVWLGFDPNYYHSGPADGTRVSQE